MPSCPVIPSEARNLPPFAERKGVRGMHTSSKITAHHHNHSSNNPIRMAVFLDCVHADFDAESWFARHFEVLPMEVDGFF